MLLAFLAVPLGMRGQTLVFDFEEESAHRTSGNNSYGNTANTYSENEVTITLTYADAVTSGTPISGTANMMGRIAKNTTNSPIMVIGPINISEWSSVSSVSFKTNGPNTVTEKFFVSTDGTNYTEKLSFALPGNTAETKTADNLSITGSELYIKWTGSVTTSTNSNRDFRVDDVTIAYSSGGSLPTVTTPTFSPAAGEVVSGTTVSISCTPADATIYYTTDGSTPTTSSTVYTEAITINSDMTIKAMGVKEGYNNSEVAVAAYTTILPTVTTPTFSPSAGEVVSGTTVSISCTPADATIYYTTDGSTPTTSSTVYTGAITINSDMTIKAIGVKEGYNNSEVAMAAYTIIAAVSGYTIDFESDLNAYVDWEMLNMGNSNSAITAHGGSKYGANINDGGNGVTTASITTKEKIANPGNLTCYVSKTSNNSNSSNWYIEVSSDGTTWTQAGTQNASSMSKGVWVEFSADLSSYDNVFVRVRYDGGTGTAIRAIDDLSLQMASSIAAPTFSPAAGTYTETQTVTISCTTDGATIYYTTDGSTPSAVNGTQGTSVTVNTSMTLKAIAIKGEESSSVATAEYTINLPTEYSTIAAFKAAFSATSTDLVKITGTLTVVYQHGKDLYVQDNTGGLLIYDSNSQVTGTYENGQTISNIYGTYTKYKNLVEFIPDRDLPTPGTGDVVEPIDITELTTSNYSDYESRLVRLSGIMFDADANLSISGNVENVTMIDNDNNEVVLRNGFKTLAGSIAETDMANVTGFATIYNSNIQLFPRDNNDIQMILSTMDITSDVTIDFAAILESNEIIEIENGGVLTIGGTFTNNGDLFIEDGAQMKCNSPFIGTIEKSITGYENYTGTGNGGYYLIASPVDAFVNPTLVPTNSNDEYLFDDMDFYWFDGHEVGQEWQNPKNGSADGSINGLQLMPSKKGFLYARKGTGVISISADNNNMFPATGTDIVADNLSNVSTAFGKHNLIGNPYTCNAFVGRAYYRMNPAGDDFTAAAASEPIKPLEGVFIVFGETETADEVTFTTTDPTSLNAGPTNSNISINASKVVTTRGNSNDVLIDRAIVHFGEGQMLPKFMLNPDNTKLYIPQGNKDYAVVRSEARGELPVNFKAAENGTYTINVEVENLEVNYLHLIDNLTGMDVDLLATPSYTFEARKSDIASRFRLVFDANTGNDETNDNFAFINNGELVVNGNGTVQVIDILGRQMFSHEVNSAFRIQNSSFAPGVYVLRLINGNDVKTQKIVIK